MDNGLDHVEFKKTIQQKVLVLLSCDYPLWCRHLACNIDRAGWKPAPQKIDFLPIRHKKFVPSQMNQFRDLGSVRGCFEMHGKFDIQTVRLQIGLAVRGLFTMPS